MKRATKTKRGRPKIQKTEDKIFVGMQMPNGLAKNLNKDAARNFRTRSQHILWILTDYIVRNIHFIRGEAKSHNITAEKPTNQPIYTEEEMNQLYKAHKKENE